MTIMPPEPVYRYRATCVEVHDGDTYKLDIDLGFGVTVRQSIRLHGVNCPELNTPPGKLAQRFVASMFSVQDLTILVQTYRDERTFGRWVADVWLNGVSLADIIVDHGHGVVLVR